MRNPIRRLILTGLGCGLALFAAPADETPHAAVEHILHGRYQPAVELLEKLLAPSEGGAAEATRAAMYTNLGTAYHKLGRNAEAEKAFHKSVKMWAELGLTNTLEYGISVNNLGDALMGQHFYDRAQAMFQDALKVFCGLRNQPRQEIGVTLNNLAMIAQNERKPAEAERYYREAIETLRGAAPENGLLSTQQFAGIVNNLGYLYKEQKRYSEARDMYLQALKIWEERLGPVHPDMVFGLHNLGILELELNQTAQAEEHLRRALEMAKATLPPEHELFGTIYSAYAVLLKKTGRKQEAKQLEASARINRSKQSEANYGNVMVDVRTLLR